MRLLLCITLLAAICASCKKYPKDESFPPNKPVTVDSSSAYHFTGYVDTSLVGIYDGFSSYFNANQNTVTNKPAPDSSYIVFGSSIKKTSATILALSIEKGQLYFTGSQPSDLSFQNFFQQGTVPYATLLSPDGIVVKWTDDSGNTWSSLQGDQSSSSFNITQADVGVLSGVTLMKVHCTFSCKVYFNSSSKTISDAKFYGAFKNN